MRMQKADTNTVPRLFYTVSRVAAFAVLAVCPGCAHYHPEPLSPAAVQQQLLRFSQADFAAAYCRAGHTDPAPTLADGLGADEVGLAALILNPALKTKRLERGIAAGQLVTAGLYPNPSFDTRTLPFSQKPIHRKSVEASMSFEILRWQERVAEKQAKTANVQAVQYDILSDEWKTVSETRAAYWNAVAAREKLRLNSEEMTLSERLRDSVKARIKHGAGTAFDSNLAEMQHLKLQMERQKVESDVDTADRTLKSAIGLPYDVEIKLRIAANPLAHRPLVVKLPELVASLSDSAMMKASQWRYEVSEGDLRAAIARQYPSIKLGPGSTFDFDGKAWSSLYGLVGTIDVPLIGRNQGEIQEKTAARDLARADYTAKLQAAQSAVAAAVAQVESAERRLQFQEKELLPKAQESMKLTEKAYAAGDIAGSELLTARSLFVDAEKSHLDLLIDYRTALESLEAALGRRLEDALNDGEKR